MSSYRKGSHSLFDLKVHVVWITKYRKPVLSGEVGQELRFGKPVEMFLNHYPGIPNTKAWLVRATFLGAHLPYKYWPSCVWEDRISADQPSRLFRQVVTGDGFPVGAAQSWPITDFARRNGSITKLNML